MSHYSYMEKRKDLRPWIDMVCGWAEASFVIGGIAFHKVADLEKRLDKMIPVQGKFNRTYNVGDNVAFDQSRAEHVKLLYRAWSALSDLVELENKSKGGSRTSFAPTTEQWSIAFDKAREIFKEQDQL